jgi:glycosyltransferase involved in cell wall biosynthesis
MDAGSHPVELSFVVPAYNEERLIAETLQRIHDIVGGRYPYSLTVVDNGSSDATVELALSGKAEVISDPKGTVSTLRNIGATRSGGDILIFLDADVLLTEQWVARLPHTLRELSRSPRTITGSWCGVSAAPSWIERYWFKPLLNGRNTHINSGHLIIARRFFEELHGFDPSLETGEDYDLSVRAVARGGQIVDDPLLEVEHRGYPRTVREFVSREIWHGRSDFHSVHAIFRSKIALASLAFLALHAALLGSFALGSLRAAQLASLLILLLCIGAAAAKYRAQPVLVVLLNSILYYAYFLGRSLAFVAAHARAGGRHQRGAT